MSELSQQSDIEVISRLGEGVFASVYKVNVQSDKGKKLQVARVLKDVKNHYILKREKDLLHYFNQYKKHFPSFNEIRKNNFHYIQLFDYVGEESLEKLVKRQGRLEGKDVKVLLEKMLFTLDKAHSVGFVHSDIKPENIIVGETSYFLIDWSQAMPSLSSFETELMIGDKRYTPPERMNGQYSESGDIYSLGCTLYYALMGKHIYGLEGVDDAIKRLFAQANFSPSNLSELDEKWRDLVIWMTQKNPQDRPSLLEVKSWLNTGIVPLNSRKTSVTSVNQFPEDCLTELSCHNYAYALLKKAIALEEKQSFKQAFQIYENLAFRGYSRAENNMAKLLELGRGVAQSFSKAAYFYERAFKKGNSFSASNLGRLFEQGKGVTKNLNQSFKFTYFAAMRGRGVAQTRLGELYLMGKGVALSKEKAVFWLGLAAINGGDKAKKMLGDLQR